MELCLRVSISSCDTVQYMPMYSSVCIYGIFVCPQRLCLCTCVCLSVYVAVLLCASYAQNTHTYTHSQLKSLISKHHFIPIHSVWSLSQSVCGWWAIYQAFSVSLISVFRGTQGQNNNNNSNKTFFPENRPFFLFFLLWEKIVCSHSILLRANWICPLFSSLPSSAPSPSLSFVAQTALPWQLPAVLILFGPANLLFSSRHSSLNTQYSPFSHPLTSPPLIKSTYVKTWRMKFRDNSICMPTMCFQ